MRRDNRVRVDGAAAAELYQTYGVPPELFEALATEQQTGGTVPALDCR